MAGRLGIVLYWLGIIVALLFLAAAIGVQYAGANELNPKWVFQAILALFAIFSWLAGKALRFILTGD